MILRVVSVWAEGDIPGVGRKDENNGENWFGQ